MAKNEDDPKENASVFFIPAGTLLGMGVGFLINNLVAGMFIGIGAGFALFALTNLFIAKK